MNFVGGALKLKGLTKPVTQISLKSKDIKKDKKKEQKREEKRPEKKEEKRQEKKSENNEEIKPVLVDVQKNVEEYLTPAQRQFREIQMLRLKQKVQSGGGDLMTGHR
jgi:hypothetical protein